VSPPPEHTESPGHLSATLIALLVTFLWSTSWILIRWGLDDEALEPLTFAALRYGMAAVVLVGWVLGRPQTRAALRSIDRRRWLDLAALGVVFYSLTQGAQFVAIDNQPAATTSLVLSLTPLVVAGLGVVFLSERPTGQQVLGTMLVLAGAWLFFAGDLGATAVGMAAAVVGLGANVAAGLLGRYVNRDAAEPAVVVTAASMAIGVVVLVGVGLATEGVPSISARAWLIIAWLAIVNTALAFSLWNLSLQRLSAVESAGINNTMLVQIAVLAWIFLGEVPGLQALAGIGLVSVGVFLTQTVLSARRR
jgi:drug/metabolite transporter (DMT)-like permease